MSPPLPILGWVRCVTATVALLAAAAAGFLPADKARASAYRFNNIADTSGPFSVVATPQAINNDGVVVFQADLDSGPRGLFTSNGDSFTTIADTTGQISNFGWHDLNNDGTVAFEAFLRNGEDGVFVGDGGPVTMLYDTASRPLESLGNSRVTINDGGGVAFSALRQNPVTFETETVIFSTDGESLRVVADENGPYDSVWWPVINNGGDVAFYAELEAGGRAVLKESDGGITTLYELPSDIYSVHLPFPFNNNGVLGLVIGRADSLKDMLVTTDGGPIDVIAERTESFICCSHVGLNDDGQVAFVSAWETLGKQRLGVFTGSDPINDRVILEGDSLFGSTVTYADQFAVTPINNHGQVTFHYHLENGVEGIAVATPILDVPGDTNGDGRVDIDDLNAVRNNFGAMGDPDGTLDGDAFPFDGLVDIDDLNAVRNNFGAMAAPVPEAATWILTVIGAPVVLLAGLRWRES